MNGKKLIGFLFVLFFAFIKINATSDTIEIKKKGINILGIPAVAFDTDIGLKYGILANLYQFGDGSFYPEYKHSFNIELSRTTKGNKTYQIIYDSKHLIEKYRINAELSHLSEIAFDFYGFNGYQSVYTKEFENANSSRYISRAFYKHSRSISKFRFDIQKEISNVKYARFQFGIEATNTLVNPTDIDKINKGLAESDKLPDTASLFEKYIEWGLIKENEKNGGFHTLLKAGFIIDTRKHEVNPMQGYWSEALILFAPSFISNRNFNYVRYAFTHRHYLPLIHEKLNFATRVSFQGKLYGDIPFYMLPFVYNTAPNYTRDGPGGFKTIRGILRNRMVGDDFAYANLELRYSPFHFALLRQNMYFTFIAFSDAGWITKEHTLKSNLAVLNKPDFFSDNKNIHLSLGTGVYLVVNQNFALCLNAAQPVNKQDGGIGFYMGMNFQF